MGDNFMADIFGADSDDEKEIQEVRPVVKDIDQVDELLDSDEEAPRRSGGMDDLLDSDDEDGDEEDGGETSKPKRLGKRKLKPDRNRASDKRKKLEKRNRLLQKSTADVEDGKAVKLRRQKKERHDKTEKRDKKSKGQDGGQGKREESGDEYDSGEEAPITREDEQFIDGEDDHDDLLQEYDQDNQDFDDDERPLSRPKKQHAASSKPKSASTGDGTIRNRATGELDPVSKALLEMKRPKTVEWSDTQKIATIEKLQMQMMLAAKRDDALIANGSQQPAVHKLQLLPTVIQIMQMKFLHALMLEKDILLTLREWILPRKDPRSNGTVLPALNIRTAIYTILSTLPVHADQLKRRDDDRPPIGHYIALLKKHPQETEENRRLLQRLMEKWCNDIFGKATDVRGGQAAGAYREDYEMQLALHQKYTLGGGKVTSNTSSSSSTVPSASSAAGGSAVDAGDLVTAGKAALAIKAGSSRARTPYSLGHTFTVVPDFKRVSLSGKKKDDEAMEVKDRKVGGGGKKGGDGGSGRGGGQGAGGEEKMMKRTESRGANAGQFTAAMRGGGRAMAVSISRPNYSFA